MKHPQAPAVFLPLQHLKKFQKPASNSSPRQAAAPAVPALPAHLAARFGHPPALHAELLP